MRTRIKICGITNREDAFLATDLGAYALGFVFYRQSRRFASPEKTRDIIKALPPFVVKVGVFVNEEWDLIIKTREFCGLDRVQTHCDDPLSYNAVSGFMPDITITGFRIRDAADLETARRSAFPLLDAFQEGEYGGTGFSFDWSLLRGFDRPFILAGGIGLHNIEAAFQANPYAIDIASGVEKAPGIKDPGKMRRLFDAVDRFAVADRV